MPKQTSSFQVLIAFVSVSIFTALACNLPGKSQPDTRATLNAALTEVNAENLPTSEQVDSNQEDTQSTSTPSPEASVTPTQESQTPLPTAASIEGNIFAEDLIQRGHELLASSSVIGPKDYQYSAYLFLNTRIDPYADELRPEICRLAIYRQDADENALLRSFTAPQFPPGSRYTYPVRCEAINWDAPSQQMTLGGEITPETRALLGMSGHWSDINQNGLPEFAVYYQYCAQGCLDYGVPAVHFYEIKNTYQPVHITADSPGVLLPWDLTHTTDPLTLRAYDAALEYEPLVFIETSWVLAWDGNTFEDVTDQYADEYAEQRAQIAREIQEEYGMPLTDRHPEMLKILVLANKADLSRDQTLTTFLDVTNPAHWPGTDSTLSCWLQLGRAYAQRDAAAGRPFTLPPNQNEINGPNLDDII